MVGQVYTSPRMLFPSSRIFFGNSPSLTIEYSAVTSSPFKSSRITNFLQKAIDEAMVLPRVLPVCMDCKAFEYEEASRKTAGVCFVARTFGFPGVS